MQLIIDKKEKINSYLNSCDLEYNEYGKPYIKNNEFYFNKSHTNKLSVLIINNNECGIDIETIRKYKPIMAKKILSKDECELINKKENKDYYFTLIWTLKESYLKALGTGINTKLNEISFVENNKLILIKDNYKFKIIKIENYIITSCRRD